MRKKIMTIVSLIILGSLALTACGPRVQEGSVATGEGQVVFDGFDDTDIPTLDPQLGEDSVSINYIENLFVHLTNYDLATADIVPEAATSWEISEDGLIYTFHLREDIPWVKHNPETGEVLQEVDQDGNPRFLTADDFVYGIKRACNPSTGSYYSGIIAGVIKGCGAVFGAEDPDNISQTMIDAIGVSAPDSATLVIELPQPAAYFLSMTPMWTIAATPQWAIEEYGDEWIEAGNIVTNGRYVLNEWDHGVSRRIVRNPLMPEDMRGEGNIDVFSVSVVPETSTGYSLWLNNQVDISGIPDAELQSHLSEFGDETIQIPTLGVFYIAFRQSKPPFDNVHVRRAFSAAYDRNAHVDVIEQDQGLVMTHFAPPGIFGAPPINEVGISFDPEYAREELALAGYPDCEGFPQVSLLGYSGEHTLNWIEFAQAQWEENLGCSADLIQIEQQTFADLLITTKADDAEAPHMWTLAWSPDYADENNWVGDVLDCNIEVRMHRTCSEVDDLVEEARFEPDPEVRKDLYRQIEDKYFGYEGEVPFFPIFVEIAYVAQHSWVDRIPALFGGEQYYNWHIDQESKLQAKQ